MYDRRDFAGWRERSVYELARWKNGLAFKNIDFSPSGRPVIKIAELKAGITPQTARTSATYDQSVFVRAGDMLFSWSGNPDTSIDVFRWRGEDGWLNQHIFKVTPDEGIDEEFLFFVLRWLKPRFAEIARNKQTTGLGHVTLQDLKRMVVGVPELDEQRRITSIVSPYEDKIELNRRMNETLEAMAQAIFRDWFVDFGPVRRKLAGETDPVAIMGGLSADPARAAEVAGLFPATLGEEGLPEGWTAGAAGALIEFNPREPLRKGAAAPYSDMSSLPTVGSNADLPIMRDFGSGMRFRNGDALLARITPCLENGKAAFVDFLTEEFPVGWGSTEFIVHRARPGTPRALPYLLCRNDDYRSHAIQSMTGTSGRQRAQAESLEAWPMAIPTGPVLDAFSAFVDAFFDRISANGRENRTLAETRDYLLPRLMSGQVRVGESAKFASEVAA
ncbi:restriction endonuclease subunit S [Brevundimonas sp.]|uniref:restriction endonuclease subunit S n=1 Tax=Brevundimonas sp. TaxID=1871086 RepID=UPI001D75DF30|nr:restriction endonuclease subunit S [Brevundimonas sp.]MBL0946841.1 restriction endonuclease subunit S [Brevundimonas sp.]